jgi:hypothetical protein
LTGGTFDAFRPTAALGAGAYYVFPDYPRYPHRISHATVPGIHAKLEIPVLRFSRASSTIGITGVLIPTVHDQTATQLALQLGSRVW